jgi:hypothetical protein
VRDPVRIRRISALLTALWWQNPDMRLGQLIENARAFSQEGKAPEMWPDTFCIEDDLIETGLKALLEMEK